MSACIVIANKEGVALAADSAVTVDGKFTFNHAKKIYKFQNHKNIAAVFSGQTAFMGVELGILTHLFDRDYSDNPNRVLDLGTEFIRFISTFKFDKDSEERFIYNNIIEIYNYHFPNGYSLIDYSTVKTGYKKSNNLDLSNRIIKYIKKHHKDVIEIIRKDLKSFISTKESNELLDFLIDVFSSSNYFFKNSKYTLVGYGKEQIYPSVLSITLFGALDGILFFENLDYKEVDSNNELIMTFLGQDRTFNIFHDGIHYDQFKELLGIFNETLRVVIDNFMLDENENTKFSSQGIIDGIGSSFLEMFNTFVEENTYELELGLSKLNAIEMANYAKSMILVSILRSKYPTPQDYFETIGGEIVVATIDIQSGFEFL